MLNEQSQQNEETAAQSSAPTGNAPAGAPPVTGGLIAVGALLFIAVIGGLFILRARKKLLATESDSQSAGLLLDDMRNLLKRGEISQEEFDATRKSLAAKLKATHGPASPSPRHTPSK